MKAYIIHKHEDEKTVKRELDLLHSNCNFESLLLTEQQSNWKRYANQKIKEADCAIYYVGSEAHNSPNIDWELRRFIKLNKPIYVIKLEDDNKLNEVLYRRDSFGNAKRAADQQETYSKTVNFDSLVKIIQNGLELDVSQKVIANSEMNPNVLIEQYKAYLKTSEDVVARRQSVSNFYITVNATLLSILSTLIAILNLLGKDYSPYITVASCFLLSVLGVVLCYNWRRLIYSYGQLNAAKMKVISAIEKNLPFDIYDVEWQVQTDKLGKKKYVSFTSIEKMIPLLFVGIYCIIFVVAIILTVFLFV